MPACRADGGEEVETSIVIASVSEAIQGPRTRPGLLRRPGLQGTWPHAQRRLGAPRNDGSAALLVQLERQVRLHRRPLGGDDAVDARIAQRAVRRDLVIAQDAVELGAEPLDAA